MYRLRQFWWSFPKRWKRNLVMICLAGLPSVGLAQQAGFNELFIMSHLKFVDRYNGLFTKICVAPQRPCPLNMPPLADSRAAHLLYNFEINDRKLKTIRDIIPLRLVGDGRGGAPLDSEIAAMLRVYQQRDVELILAFSAPLPDGWHGDFESVDRIAHSIGHFLARMRYWYGLDQEWMASRLKVEPLNEVNGENGSPAFAALLDNRTLDYLRYYSVPFNEVLSSSVISDTESRFLEWYRGYYAAGGKAVPNVHLYPHAGYDEDILEYTIARFERVVFRLRNQSHSSRRVVIGELGFPRAGMNSARSANSHSRFLGAVLNSPVLRTADRIVFWRLFSDFLPNGFECTDSNCDPLTARETTYGFINFNSSAFESQMRSLFLPIGLWWSSK